MNDEYRARLLAILNFSPEAITITDLNNVITECGVATLRLHGYETKDELIGIPTSILIAPEDRWLLDKGNKEVMEKGIIRNLDVRLQRKDGSVFDGELSVSLVRNEAGDAEGMIGITKDITARKRAEDVVRESEQTYRELLENLNDVVFIVDPNGVVRFITPSVVRITGYRAEDVIGRNLFDFLSDEEKSKYMADLRNSMESGRSVGEYLITVKNGMKKWIRSSSSIITENGKVVGLRGIMTDVTERKLVEEALRENQEKYRALVDTTETGYLILDESGRVVDANQDYVKLTGRKNLEEILGRSVVEWTAPYDVERNADEVRKCAETGVVKNLEIDYVDGSGRVTPVEINAKVVESKDGKRILSLCRDITERRRAEEALKESEKRYRTLFSHASEGIFIMSMDGKTRMFNESFAKMHGYESPEEMEHLKLEDIDTPETARLAAERLERLAAGEWMNFEVEHYHKDGHSFPLSVSCNVVEIGGSPHFLGFHRDITELKQAEKALKESEEQLRLLYRNVDEGVILYDTGFRYVLWNPYMERLTGMKASEVMGKCALDLFPHLKEHGADILLRRALEGETVEAANMVYVSPNEGKERRTTGRYQPHRNAEGEIVGVLGIVRDTTDMWLVEKQLKESEEQFRLAFENSKDAVFWADAETHLFLRCNKSAEQLVERTRDEIIGKHMSFLHPDGKAKEYDATFREQMKSPMSRVQEAEVLTKSGRLVPVEISSTIVEISGKTIIQGIFRDLTERNNAQAERDALLQQLHQSQKMDAIGKLAGGIAHDFNNILAVIIGTADLVVGSMGAEWRGRRHMERIIKVAKRAKDLTMNLLTFARKEKLEIRTVPAGVLITELTDLLKRSISKKIKIKTDVRDGEALLTVDMNQMLQALLNVCINAADAMSEGGTLMIECGTAHLGARESERLSGIALGSYYRIVIADTGTGMADEIKEHIFTPFFTTKERGKGTGLGLSITLGIVQNHGGAINVDSELGKGTTVEICLPISEGQAAAPEGAVAADRQNAVAGTVLVVDDDPDFLEMIGETLREKGLDVIPAPGPSKALELYRKHEKKIDAVILDMMMPEMGGEEVFRLLRKINPQVKVVVCSGYSKDGKAGQILSEGADGFLQKPFDSEQLMSVVSDLLK